MRTDNYDEDTVKKTPQVETALEKHGDVNILTSQMGTPSFLSQLKIYNGTFSDKGLWMIFMRPFVLVRSPAVRTTHVRFSILHILI